MFALNIMRKRAMTPTGSTNELRMKLTDMYAFAKFIRGICPTVGGHLVIARFSHYIQLEHSITPPSRNLVYEILWDTQR